VCVTAPPFSARIVAWYADGAVKAAVLRRFGESLVLEERPVPEPGREGVLVRVRGAGVCHTDLHIVDGRHPEVPLPRVLGHEIAGEAEDLGEVLVWASWGCGTCEWCVRGDEQLCPHATDAGWRRDGGYAEYVVVPSRRYLLPLRGLDPVRAAPLADAGLTPYRAVHRVRPWLEGGGTAVVIGVGGLGQFALQYLRLFTQARVVAVDHSEAKLTRARELGASEAVLPRDSPASARVVLDFVGSEQTLALATKAVERGGIVVQVGDGGGRVPFGLGTSPDEAVLTTSIWGSRRDLEAVLACARRGDVEWDVEALPLAEANTALARLRQGDVRGRLVLVP
jgi:propanol-preferring alcohol dehydrogenase